MCVCVGGGSDYYQKGKGCAARSTGPLLNCFLIPFAFFSH